MQVTLSLKPFQYLHMLDVSEACIMKMWMSCISFYFYNMSSNMSLLWKGLFTSTKKKVHAMHSGWWCIPRNYKHSKRHPILLTQLLLQQLSSPWKLWHSVILPLLTVQRLVQWFLFPQKHLPCHHLWDIFAMWNPPVVGTKFRKSSGCFKKISVTMQ